MNLDKIGRGVVNFLCKDDEGNWDFTKIAINALTIVPGVNLVSRAAWIGVKVANTGARALTVGGVKLGGKAVKTVANIGRTKNVANAARVAESAKLGATPATELAKNAAAKDVISGFFKMQSKSGINKKPIFSYNSIGGLGKDAVSLAVSKSSLKVFGPRIALSGGAKLYNHIRGDIGKLFLTMEEYVGGNKKNLRDIGNSATLAGASLALGDKDIHTSSSLNPFNNIYSTLPNTKDILEKSVKFETGETKMANNPTPLDYRIKNKIPMNEPNIDKEINGIRV